MPDPHLPLPQRLQTIIAMDRTNLINVQSWAPARYNGEIRLLMECCRHNGSSQIPDPLYQASENLEEMMPLLEKAIDGLLSHIAHQHSL